MNKSPQLSSREVIRKLKRLGFAEVRQRGSHLVMRNDDTKATTVVPCHSSRNLKRGTLHSILVSAGVSLDEFINA